MHTFRHLFRQFAFGAAFAALASPGLADTRIWNTGTSDWNTPANWSPAFVPGALDEAQINNSGTAQISAGAAAFTLILGDNVGESGSLQILTGANLTVSDTLLVGGYTGNGTGNVIQSGGTVTADTIRLGTTDGGSGTYQLAGGSVSTATIVVGDYGTGNFSIASPATLATTGSLLVGSKAAGDFTQNGGTVNVGGYFAVGATSGTFAANYNLVSGTLDLARGESAEIGNTGSAALHLGSSAGGTVTVSESGTGAGRNLTVRTDAAASGLVRGYGTFGITGSLTNNGRIIADGYSTADRTLDFSSASTIGNTIENPASGGTNGWFATGRGTLALPALTIASGNSTANWGESAADTTIDLVNSAALAFSNIASGGNFSLSLLSPDSGSVPGGLAGTVIGLWQVGTSGGFAFGSGSLAATFRYDDAAAGSATPALFAYDGLTWQDLTASLDTTNKLITSQSQSSAQFFAVVVPEPSSALLALAGLAAVFGFVRGSRHRQ